MDESVAFMSVICREPGDDTHRLVFADWLEERREGERAKFIREQVAFAREYPNVSDRQAWWSEAGERHRADKSIRRTTALFETAFSPLPVTPLPLWHSTVRKQFAVYAAHPAWFATGFKNVHPSWVDRGFLSGVSTTESQWLRLGRRILTVQPVSAVVLNNRRPYMDWTASGLFYGWYNAGHAPINVFRGMSRANFLHPMLFNLLPGVTNGDTRYMYRTERAAFEALSMAAVLFAATGSEL